MIAIVLAILARMKGIVLDARDCDGRTALHLAACRSHAQAVFLLLDLGGLRMAEAKDGYGMTALQLAAVNGEEQTIRILIQVSARLL